jgi:hypothetical protein
VRAPIGRWWLKSFVIGGHDLLDRPLELRAATSVARVTFSDRATALSGIARDADGMPAAEAFVIIFDARKESWFAGSRRIAGIRVSADGRYVVRNLPPGEYLVAVTHDVEPEEWFDPHMLESLIRTAVSISLDPDEAKVLDVVTVR